MTTETVSETEAVEITNRRHTRLELQGMTDRIGRPISHPDQEPLGAEWGGLSGSSIYGRQAWRVVELTQWETIRVLTGEQYTEDPD